MPKNHFPVVGVGASAGGLEAFRKLLEAMPPDNGMAFILIQHLDPTHPSMMVELLAAHTSMKIQHAADGMLLEREHVYVIPPGVSLSVRGGSLQLSEPRERHGARLPFDFLLRSLADEFGESAIAVILSGTGADGSLGLRAVKEKCGLVVVQDPGEAGQDGMPRSAIATGAVDLVRPVAQIAEALVKHARRTTRRSQTDFAAQDPPPTWLPAIIDLLRTETAHDFALYKPGTLQRRIERRMALAIDGDDPAHYIERLRIDPRELEQLAKDLLINVTSFFRDPKVFDLLAEKVVPEIVRGRSRGEPIRVWVAGCSTGEEAYSLAMLFHEEMAAAHRNLKLQVFASDIDPDAVAAAREGLYPDVIEADVSPARLARFFAKEDRGYRVSPELRAAVVFTVQDVLVDPPFSRIDLISCRNLLIYLQPKAQAKIISFFHFALREGGIFLVGGSETAVDIEGRFDVVSKSGRLYRRSGRSGHPAVSPIPGARTPARAAEGQALLQRTALADLCRRLVMENYAPAAVLVNRGHECLHSTGPVDRYLRVVTGQPTHDVLAMAREDVRIKLRSALQRASQERSRVVVPGGRLKRDGQTLAFKIAIQPVRNEDEELLLICFLEEKPSARRSRRTSPADVSRAAELETELETTRAELQGAIRDLENAVEEQKSYHEEALSVSEEFQATNEELLTSKEELQSLNEELTALNSQLQETLERQRTTASDLQNVLYSTNVATLFLDLDLNIRFFTPATKSLFRIIATDVGRPLADLSSLAADAALLTDAQTVMTTLAPLEREIEARSGTWYLRRVLPYRTQDNRVAGVVITFVDVTERKRTADALEAARREAEQASLAKSRFLSIASHDLRQPLQTLALLQGLLARTVEGEKAQRLVARLDETLGSTSGMLNALLDINRIEAGTVHAEIIAFSVRELFERLKSEFTYHTQARELSLRVVSCGLAVQSDPPLLEQMIRNLLANALKYTKHGRVLLGCRRRGGKLSIEVWDTGIGIPEADLQVIFEEYRQLDNAAQERSRGLGLGLSVVQRLGTLLNHPIRVRSQLGKGSVFAIEVPLASHGEASGLEGRRFEAEDVQDERRSGTILVVEDEPEVRELLEMVLEDEGHRVAAARDGRLALEAVAKRSVQPDVLLVDYNLPNGLNGLQLVGRLRETLQRELPAIVLTGDISTTTLREVASRECVQLNKPVNVVKLAQVIQRLLPVRTSSEPHARHSAEAARQPVVFVVDDDSHVRDGLRAVLEEEGIAVKDYAECEAFLAAYRPPHEGCLLIDAYLPGMNGFELLQRLSDAGHQLPAVMITGNSDVPMAVRAMKAGVIDFIEKPVGRNDLLASVQHALELSRDAGKLSAWRQDAAGRIARLTPRQRQIMELVLAGHPSKNIAADLRIGQRTVENHRAAIMKRTGSKSLPALARLALAAAAGSTE